MDNSWTPAEAAHLLNRAGFGGSPSEVLQLHALGRAKAVQSLINGIDESDLFLAPKLKPIEQTFADGNARKLIMDPLEKREAAKNEQKQQGEDLRQLKEWWLQRMRYTTFPLREKMTLFWHGHFATSYEKVNITYLMWQQNETLRANALGNFGKLTKEISKDAAMMRYLDLPASKRQKPNENFARELMELFMLGEGVKYTEQDIQEAARAFTGYRFELRDASFHLIRTQHDPEEKTFLGQKGKFNGDDIIEIVLEQPECADFIAKKIWVFLAGTQPSPALAKNLSASFRQSGYQVSALLSSIFLNPEFYSAEVMRRQVKSPVQWMVQASKNLEAPLPRASYTENSLKNLGQNLFLPPNVKGWDGGKNWINSSTYLARCNIAGNLVTVDERKVTLMIPWDKIAPKDLRDNPEKLVDELSFRFYGGPVNAKDRARFISFLREQDPSQPEDTFRRLVHLMMSAPDYQLT